MDNRVKSSVTGASYSGSTLTLTKDDGSSFTVEITRPEGGTISVQLTNSKYQSYLAGATVTATCGSYSATGVTDSAGHVDISVTQAGSYTIRTQPTYFLSKSGSCTISNTQNITLNPSPESTQSSVSGYLVGRWDIPNLFQIGAGSISSTKGSNPWTPSKYCTVTTGSSSSGAINSDSGYLPVARLVTWAYKPVLGSQETTYTSLDEHIFDSSALQSSIRTKVLSVLPSDVESNGSDCPYTMRVTVKFTFRWAYNLNGEDVFAINSANQYAMNAGTATAYFVVDPGGTVTSKGIVSVDLETNTAYYNDYANLYMVSYSGTITREES